jgi:hypothetical protein
MQKQILGSNALTADEKLTNSFYYNPIFLSVLNLFNMFSKDKVLSKDIVANSSSF